LDAANMIFSAQDSSLFRQVDIRSRAWCAVDGSRDTQFGLNKKVDGYGQ